MGMYDGNERDLIVYHRLAMHAYRVDDDGKKEHGTSG